MKIRGKYAALSNIGHDFAGKALNVHIENLSWKTDNRLLFRTRLWSYSSTGKKTA